MPDPETPAATPADSQPETEAAAHPAVGGPTAGDPEGDERLRELVEQLLVELARLLVARGIGFPETEQMLARAYVDAALRWYAESDRPTASRLYMLTGIHRKKIAPLMAPRGRRRATPSLSQQVRDRLSSHEQLLDRRGQVKPLALTRKEGGELSFEAIVESISKDVRPRAVLDQWLSSGMAHLDARGRLRLDLRADDTGYAADAKVELLDRIARPALSAAVASLLGSRQRSSTMAVVVDELHPDDAVTLQLQWRERLRNEMMRFNSQAERHAAEARRAGRLGRCTLRVGGFEWVDGAPPAAPEEPPDPAPPRPRPRRAPRRRAPD